jgi:molecular chaperone Hsp33
MSAAGAPLTDDIVQPFQIEGANLRGRLVRLGEVVDSVLTRHAYPDPVARLLGEALTLCAILATALKFEGVFTLQARGDGPVSMLVVDYRTSGDLRGYASFKEERLTEVLKKGNVDSAPVPRLLGAGHLALTVDQGPDTERYQGIVELEGATLADCAHAYFRQSEQLETGIRLAVERDGGGRWHAGGLMIQRLPQAPGLAKDEIEDAWRRALILMGSLTPKELALADVTPHRLLFRLFHEDGVRAFDVAPLAARCRCSEHRIASVLGNYPVEERREMAENGLIRVTCEFCNRRYDFEPDDLTLAGG